MTTTSPPISLLNPTCSIPWNGGDNFYDGPHDDFCFVCGGTMSLIGCQTCENCYHIDCMSPSPEKAPAFWFCPHCTDREWHIPPTSIDIPTPTTTGAYLTPDSQLFQESHENEIEQTGQKSDWNPHETIDDTGCEKESLKSNRQSQQKSNEVLAINASSVATPKRKFDTAVDRALYQFEVNQQQSRWRPNATSPKPTSKSPSKRPPPSSTHSISSNSNSNPTISSTQPSTSKPPRKRSKYSSLSSTVDDALRLIQRELETAASTSQTTSSFRERIQVLEQELLLKDRQMELSSKEIEVLKRERGSGGLNLKGENERLREENERLKTESERLKGIVESKEEELRDWRVKLKNLIGVE